MIAKMLGAAVVLGSVALLGADPASADTTQPAPNPFASLTCNCQQTTPASAGELDRGLLDGLAYGHTAAAQ
ncbi:MAG: hypothetical protein JO236_05485 [Mycobacterium sp.]|uniref:hypothetical protein n=1 Tax=Mycobacterium sp. TaxID=1785 RepID=UPI001EB4FEC9|nr:hypothetical protein [Mycobacterium sp.]MBW0016985.1 hypothetical protein [Mycobacterium sp.]